MTYPAFLSREPLLCSGRTSSFSATPKYDGPPSRNSIQHLSANNLRTKHSQKHQKFGKNETSTQNQSQKRQNVQNRRKTSPKRDNNNFFSNNYEKELQTVESNDWDMDNSMVISMPEYHSPIEEWPPTTDTIYFNSYDDGDIKLHTKTYQTIDDPYCLDNDLKSIIEELFPDVQPDERLSDFPSLPLSEIEDP